MKILTGTAFETSTLKKYYNNKSNSILINYVDIPIVVYNNLFRLEKNKNSKKKLQHIWVTTLVDYLMVQLAKDKCKEIATLKTMTKSVLYFEMILAETDLQERSRKAAKTEPTQNLSQQQPSISLGTPERQRERVLALARFVNLKVLTFYLRYCIMRV